MKWANLENRSTITQIESCLCCVIGKPTMKSMLCPPISIQEYPEVDVDQQATNDLPWPSGRYHIQTHPEFASSAQNVLEWPRDPKRSFVILTEVLDLLISTSSLWQICFTWGCTFWVTITCTQRLEVMLRLAQYPCGTIAKFSPSISRHVDFTSEEKMQLHQVLQLKALATTLALLVWYWTSRS